MAKPTKEKFKTWENVFDNFTIVTLQKIIDKGIITGILGPLSIGKEANVFVAKKDGANVIAKIFRLEVCDFKRMYDYLRYDPRYDNLQKNRRKIIFTWVQREFRNLHLARDAGVRVPTPLYSSNNVLIEEFIGHHSKDINAAAPKLKDKPPKNPQKFYSDVKKFVLLLLQKQLVHADLSPFNILNHNEQPVFIDFSQTTPLSNSCAHDYYLIDAKNIVNYFRKQGVDCSVEEFNEMWEKAKK